ncbi:hypothetical protein [Parahaliea mediterranea]|uniref:hypothetical protein n=1 Tax=Parahaliea mediterranea TaxID=651086 RepID=UPI000E2F811A|nr:hypothetical protein [Parahaliea mediterranea]
MRCNNPVDTAEQRQHEAEALAYFAHPDVVAEKALVRERWLELAQPSEVMRGCFDWAFEEVMFGAVVWALNQDPLYPRVVTITRLPHRLNGQPVPGSRWGIDNPDSIYRVIPISGDERYVITGRVAEQRLVENYFTLWSPTMQTVGLLDGKDLVLDEAGNFTIHVDSDPKGERANHIQTGPDAHEFYIRDVIFDWAGDRANELRIERLGGEPPRPPRSEAQNIALIKEYMNKWATNTTRWNAQAMDRPANEFSFTIDRDSDGALRNQIYIMGNFVLPDADTALVLDVQLGGADYFIAPITNVWGTTNEIVTRSGCLNRHQARPNSDGSYTFVLSLRDPGLHNWLDPSDMAEGILTLRWAEFAGGRAGDDVGVRSRLVPLAELEQTLPADAPRVTAAERQAQLAERAASYAWRLAGEGA